jgi:multidrug resistance efflux pump
MSEQVVAEAKVVPLREATLSMSTGGVVEEVLVIEGDSVQPGDVLVRLNAGRELAAVDQAEASLQAAQAGLDQLQAGPRAQEIEVAQAAVEAAQAQLDILTEGPRQEEVDAAQAALDSARASLERVIEGPDEEDITIAAAALRQAEVNLQQAQWAYDEIAYGAEVASSPQAAALEQASLDYDSAVARYQLAVRGSTDSEVAAARSQLAQAQSSLALLLQGATDAQLAAAEAEIHHAQAQLELIQAGARPEEIAASEAEVAAAEANLALALVSLSETELRAPFEGTVASLNVKQGERVMQADPVLELADFSAWQIETDDLTELSVVDVSPGDPVTIKVDAIPGLELDGRVLRIKELGENKHGDITYTVLIEPQQREDRLRWNMTTAVFIDPQSPGGVARR